MFVKSIERVAEFTRPIHTIMRTYKGKKVIPGAGTLFFVNEDGYAVTCKHIVELLISSDRLASQYQSFKNERNALPRDGKYNRNLKGLELKYKLTADKHIQIKNRFIDCVDTLSGFTFHVHPEHDLAILKFNGFNKIRYQGHAVFKKDCSEIKQGQFLCRLGFPFPEFNNFIYNEATDDIDWTNTGAGSSPRFPTEGMVTRFMVKDNRLYGIEMSTPGLRGQSGGPLFDKDGLVCGMQFATRHLHLGFDMVDKEILHNNKIQKISDYPFIHLGQCIHGNIIKDFLKLHQVKYYEE